MSENNPKFIFPTAPFKSFDRLESCIPRGASIDAGDGPDCFGIFIVLVAQEGVRASLAIDRIRNGRVGQSELVRRVSAHKRSCLKSRNYEVLVRDLDQIPFDRNIGIDRHQHGIRAAAEKRNGLRARQLRNVQPQCIGPGRTGDSYPIGYRVRRRRISNHHRWVQRFNQSKLKTRAVISQRQIVGSVRVLKVSGQQNTRLERFDGAEKTKRTQNACLLSAWGPPGTRQTGFQTGFESQPQTVARAHRCRQTAQELTFQRPDPKALERFPNAITKGLEIFF